MPATDGWCICEEKPLRRDPRWFPINSSVYCEDCSGTINQSSVLQVPNLNAEQQDSSYGAKSGNYLPKYVDTPLRLPYLCHLSLQTIPVLLATMTYDDWLTYKIKDTTTHWDIIIRNNQDPNTWIIPSRASWVTRSVTWPQVWVTHNIVAHLALYHEMRKREENWVVLQ